MAEEVPPHSQEAEEYVLGAILRGQTPPDRIAPDHFHIPAHRTIYTALLRLHERGLPIELPSLTERLYTAGRTDLGGDLLRIWDTYPSGANIEYYADRLLDLSHRRNLLRHLRGLETTIRDLDRPIDNLPPPPTPPTEEGDTMSLLITPETAIELPEGFDWRGIPLPTGDPTEYTLIQGDRKAGKSLFAGTLATDARRQGKEVLVVTSEGWGTWINRIRMHPTDSQPTILRSATGAALSIIRGDHYDLVIVDSIRPALRECETSENDSASVDWITARYGPLVAKGGLLILVHHLGKDPDRGGRGTRAWEDQAGIVLAVKDVGGGKSQLQATLARNHPIESLPTFTLDRTPLSDGRPPVVGRQEHTRTLTDYERVRNHLREVTEPTTKAWITEQTGVSGKRLSETLERLRKDGNAHHHPSGRGGHPLWCGISECAESPEFQLPDEAPM